jgi:hypothetical protein
MNKPNTPAVARQLPDLLPMARAKAKRTAGDIHRAHCQVYWSVYYYLQLRRRLP